MSPRGAGWLFGAKVTNEVSGCNINYTLLVFDEGYWCTRRNFYLFLLKYVGCSSNTASESS